MPRNTTLALIRAIFLLLAGLVLVSEASAHPGHHADDALRDAYQPATAIHWTLADAPQLRARDDCPNDGSGRCCCIEQIAHAPLQPCVIAAPQPVALTTRSLQRTNVLCACDAVPTTQPTVIGSGGTRGPPAA